LIHLNRFIMAFCTPSIHFRFQRFSFHVAGSVSSSHIHRKYIKFGIA
jgi:hypothetical protein